MAGGGGAWKVAYADFVTAMMALFMVLWISAQDKEILIATSRYFQQPFESPVRGSSGILKSENNTPAGSAGSGEKTAGSGHSSARNIDLQFLNTLAKDFYRMLHLDEDLSDKPIEVNVTSDGLRIVLFDRARQPLFQQNTAEFTEWGSFVMQSLAWLIDRNRFQVVIEGHTRAGVPELRPDYGAWEISSDRANAARRALTHYAVSPELIQRVTGFGDTRPVPLQPADSEGNQRVTLSLTIAKRKPVTENAPELTAPELTAASSPTKKL